MTRIWLVSVAALGMLACTSEGPLPTDVSRPGLATTATSYAARDLGTLGGDRAYALAINTAGQIVGGSTLANGQTPHAFLWSRV